MPGCSFGVLSMGHGWPGWLALLLFMAVAAFLFGRAVDWRSRGRDRRDSLAILKKRLAAGEITPEEFDRLQRYL